MSLLCLVSDLVGAKIWEELIRGPYRCLPICELCCASRPDLQGPIVDLAQLCAEMACMGIRLNITVT